MKMLQTKTASSGAAYGGDFTVLIALMLLLSACGSTRDDRIAFAPTPPELTLAERTHSDNTRVPASGNLTHTAANIQPATDGIALAPAGDTPRCSLKHRIDRSAALAYNFIDDQSRLSLHLRGGADSGGAQLRFTYKLQKLKSPHQHCLSDSRFQGLLPSLYHELAVREHGSVWDDVRAFRADLADKLK